MSIFYSLIDFNGEFPIPCLFLGLDISKHCEPAYPIGAYAESTSYQIPKPVVVKERTNPAFSNLDASMSSQPSESRLPYHRNSTSGMS